MTEQQEQAVRELREHVMPCSSAPDLYVERVVDSLRQTQLALEQALLASEVAGAEMRILIENYCPGKRGEWMNDIAFNDFISKRNRALSTTCGSAFLAERKRLRGAVKEALKCIEEWRNEEFIVMGDNDPLLIRLREAVKETK